MQSKNKSHIPTISSQLLIYIISFLSQLYPNRIPLIPMAIPGTQIGGTYQIYKAYFSWLNFRGYTPKIWPKKWYSTSILGSWNSHWLLVGVLEHFLFFHILGIIIPTDQMIFQLYPHRPGSALPQRLRTRHVRCLDARDARWAGKWWETDENHGDDPLVICYSLLLKMVIYTLWWTNIAMENHHF